MSTITHLTSLTELNKLLAAKKERLVVVSRDSPLHLSGDLDGLTLTLPAPD